MPLFEWLVVSKKYKNEDETILSAKVDYKQRENTIYLTSSSWADTIKLSNRVGYSSLSGQ
jgi:hypothetical protein